ncbi:probable ankyrin repeat and BTB/POZ domain-containing protein 1 [Rhynchosporium agropyri]|uniref:Probable ankyrin repeat and BTB/POZ domain-containing protein 1 n=1 Tax=Rhynchosporium agropyri TaxID=914238 RepID=A0A1E1KYL2_9HELO|nr:probable ankyrin repeat and BTB/POZ domain-containing protein 1 [Rhynchosporium agropyri]
MSQPNTILRKDELEVALKDEHQLIRDGVLKDDSPLDVSIDFQKLCNACRRGDLKGCQEAVASGVNINARDVFDYTPLILASLCGHYEVVQFLLEAGALCERDTFQGERCLYNALNNRIRNLLLEYDYSKSSDPLQPLASHIITLLTRQTPNTSDIYLTAGSEKWNLHKFVLSARSPYFSKKLASAPETAIWKLASSIPPEAFHIALRYLYLGDVPADLGLSNRSFVTEEEVLKGIDKVSKQLEIESLWEGLLAGSDRRIARQRHQDEVSRGREQIERWYRQNILKHKIRLESSKANDVKWTRDNSIFADVLLRADEDGPDASTFGQETPKERNTLGPLNGIPVGPSASSRSPSITRKSRQSVLFPCHRAMLARSEYFQTMFTSSFKEAQVTDYLQIIQVDCKPEVLEVVLNFIYTEQTYIPLDLALDVLFVADMLFIEKLKAKAATVISTVGMGSGGLTDRRHTEGGQDQETEVEPINVYDVIRAAWDLKVQRLEEFSARYLAFRLENYIDEQEFEDLIKESASRIQNRQETDTIELLDDIRHYLSDRFRLRFEDSGLEDMMEENEEAQDADVSSDDLPKPDEAIDMSAPSDKALDPASNPFMNGEIRTLDGEVAGDEFVADAINYQVLLDKIDGLLKKLKLDA